MSAAVTLRMLDDKAISKLPRVIKGAIVDFQHKFRLNPETPGLQLKQLKNSMLFSARVTREYRALLLNAGAADWVLLTVLHRSEAYEDLDMLAERFAYDVNPITGGLEFVDVDAVAENLGQTRASSAPDVHESGAPDVPAPLFADWPDEELRSLGVAEPLLPLIAKLTSEEELLGLLEYAPTLTADVLLALHDGRSTDEVREYITAAQAAETPVDTEDYAQALVRPATPITTDDESLRAALQDRFSGWKIFLHPSQRTLVERSYSGPARVSGGPGTGKTIVALHRARHLAQQLPAGSDRPILLTTFTRNLAADLEQKLIELAGPELAARVDVVNVNRLAYRVVTESESQPPGTVISDAKARGEWQAMLIENGENRWDADFLAEEWSQVILGRLLASWPEYAQARRAGRGRRLSRSDRKAVWRLAEQFGKRLDEQGWTTHTAISARAAELASSTSAGSTGRYRHVIVDEAQDLHPAHWKLLRALVPEDRDDIFCVGDTHQRIYDNVVSLGSLGINIRGRSAKLSLNYRTTRQILAKATRLLRGETYDDLDGGSDDLIGYRSVLHGQPPSLQGFADPTAELDGVVAQVQRWAEDGPLDSLAVCAATHDLAGAITGRLQETDIPVVTLTADGPKGKHGVYVGTMHRFKGLEFQRMIIFGVSDGLIPPSRLTQVRDKDPMRHRRERTRFRSLLFVAVTRARDDLAVFWHGKPSEFLVPTIEDDAGNSAPG